MRRQHDDGAAGGELPQPLGHDADRAIVEPGERLVEQHQPRLVQQRPLERRAAAACRARTPTPVVGAIGQAGALERRVDGGRGVEAVQPREELEILPRGQLGIQVQLVREQADARRESRPACARADWPP